MSEVQQFYDLDSVEPVLTDGVLIARERLPKTTTLGQILTLASGAITYSQTPPTEGYLWGQLDDDNNFIELWQRKGELWLSAQAYSVDTYRGSVTSSITRQGPTPYLGSKIWIESFAFQCVSGANFAVGDIADFQLRLVNSERKQVVKWYLRLENAVLNQHYQQIESVGLVVDAKDAVAVWFRVQRSSNSISVLRYCSMYTILRKVYDAST